MGETLVRVVAPHFVAGLVVVADRCTVAAPILRKWALGRSSDQLRATIKQRNWTATIVRALPDPDTLPPHPERE